MLVHILTIDMLHSCWILNLILQFTESSEALQKDVTCNKSKEHFLTAIRTLELMQVKVAFETLCEHQPSNKKTFFQTTEIEMLLETIISVSWAKFRYKGKKCAME